MLFGTDLPGQAIAGFWNTPPLTIILVSTDGDFQGLLEQIHGVGLVILRRCDYPTPIAAEVLRRNAIRIADLARSENRLLILDVTSGAK